MTTLKTQSCQHTIHLVGAIWGDLTRYLHPLTLAIEKLRNQDINIIYHLVQLSFDNNYLSFQDEKNISFDLINLEGNERMVGLWQKEALYNIALKKLGDLEIVHVMDVDIYSDEDDWLSSLFELSSKNPHKFVQAFSVCNDTKDPNYIFRSWANNQDTGYFQNPGLSLCAPVSLFREKGYFNTSYPEGSGDMAMMLEITGESSFLFNLCSWAKKGLRPYKNAGSENVISLQKKIFHINHDTPRDYANRLFYLELLKNEPLDYINLSKVGLLEVKEEGAALRELLQLSKFSEHDFESLNKQFLKIQNKLEFKVPAVFYNRSKDAKHACIKTETSALFPCIEQVSETSFKIDFLGEIKSDYVDSQNIEFVIMIPIEKLSNSIIYNVNCAKPVTAWVDHIIIDQVHGAASVMKSEGTKVTHEIELGRTFNNAEAMIRGTISTTHTQSIIVDFSSKHEKFSLKNSNFPQTTLPSHSLINLQLDNIQITESECVISLQKYEAVPFDHNSMAIVFIDDYAPNAIRGTCSLVSPPADLTHLVFGVGRSEVCNSTTILSKNDLPHHFEYAYSQAAAQRASFLISPPANFTGKFSVKISLE